MAISGLLEQFCTTVTLQAKIRACSMLIALNSKAFITIYTEWCACLLAWRLAPKSVVGFGWAFNTWLLTYQSDTLNAFGVIWYILRFLIKSWVFYHIFQETLNRHVTGLFWLLAEQNHTLRNSQRYARNMRMNKVCLASCYTKRLLIGFWFFSW